MTENRFLMNLEWELKNVFRFPFPEILLALFTYMVFTPHGGAYQGSLDLGNLSWQRITYALAFHSSYRGALYSVSAYLPMAILASIFVTLVFAYEIENGVMKVHLSHPNSRRAIFFSKWLSCFLIIFTTLSSTILLFTFLHIPQNDLYLIVNSQLILGMLLVATSESFFIVSLTAAFSIFSRKVSISLVGAFTTVYIIELLGDATNLAFLPPTSFNVQVEFLFSRIGLILSRLPDFLAMFIVSTFLTVASYIYFSRRLELD